MSLRIVARGVHGNHKQLSKYAYHEPNQAGSRHHVLCTRGGTCPMSASRLPRATRHHGYPQKACSKRAHHVSSPGLSTHLALCADSPSTFAFRPSQYTLTSISQIFAMRFLSAASLLATLAAANSVVQVNNFCSFSHWITIMNGTFFVEGEQTMELNRQVA